MFDKINTHPALFGTFSFGVTAWGSALIYFGLNDWFGAGDLRGFAFWMLIFSFLIYPILSFLSKKTSTKNLIKSYGIALLTSLLITIIFILLMLTILGAWIGAYSFPVLFCLLIGASFGTISTVYIKQPNSWVSAVVSVSMLPLIFYVLVSILLAEPNKLRISIKEEATHVEVQSLVDYIIEVDGVRGFARVDGSGETRILISFDSGLSDRRWEEIVSDLESIPIIVKLIEIENE